jgi:hypothetical protein
LGSRSALQPSHLYDNRNRFFGYLPSQAMAGNGKFCKYLQLEFTVEDKNVFTTPWTATMTYRSGGDSPLDWPENECAENRVWYPGQEADVPRAIKPDF